MSTGILRVDGTNVVDENGTPVLLRGAGLGGWMNMENFITGYPGHEKQHRAAMLAVLGEEKYNYFFNKFLEYFFLDEDAKYFASLGLNCIRLSFNYRHFEDDMNPRHLKKSGFIHLDRVVDICARNGIYTILDLHALPGGHGPNWHADNQSNYAAFWDHKDFQDRTVWLWKEIAAHYRGNPWIAGYNPMNEPCDPEHVRLPQFYKLLEKEIHQVDPEHILWLDGNTFAMEFRGFDEVLPNCVYSLHDYSMMGFPTGQPFTGTSEQKDILRSQFERKSQWQREHSAPIWNGEFGPVYANPKFEEDAEKINQQRYELLAEQMRIYDGVKIPWTIWLYKDIGLQGMVYLDPESAWMKLIGGFVEKKKKLQVDSWGKYPSEEVDKWMLPMIAWIDKNAPEATLKYPTNWPTQKHVYRAILETYVADSLQMEFARLFEGKSMKELDELAASFKYEHCRKRQGLENLMKEHASLRDHY